MRGYLFRLLIALDQGINAVLNGFEDETLSSRLGRRIKRLRGKDPLSNAACEILDKIEKDHCEISIEETPEGETDAHHLGRVIYELPRDPEKRDAGIARGLAAIEAARSHKVPKAVLAAALALLIVG